MNQESMIMKKFRFVAVEEVMGFDEDDALRNLQENLGIVHNVNFVCKGEAIMDKEDLEYAQEMQNDFEKWMKEQKD